MIPIVTKYSVNVKSLTTCFCWTKHNGEAFKKMTVFISSGCFAVIWVLRN